MSTETTQDSLINDSGLFLHASAINIGGKALIFLGHSTAGKSTISKLLSKVYSVISDDKVWVFQNNEREWFAWNGDDEKILNGTNQKDLNSKKKFPILSFIRIFKSESNKINEVEPSLLCKYLIDAVFEVDNQRNNDDINLRKQWFYLAADLSKKVKGWHLNFNKKSVIIEIIEKTFEK